MGDAIKISELARNMITLSGMTVRDDASPMGDIEIVYVGLRPGEKLYEELFVGSDSVETTHPRIKMAKERFLPFAELEPFLMRLKDGIASVDRTAVRASLRELVAPDQGQIADNVTWLRRA
jgi:FlaA1/EpsC-like NDP-sugar epimerase